MQVYREGGMVDAMNLRTEILGPDREHGYASPLRITHTSGRIIDFILLNHAAAGELVPGSGFVLGTSAQDYDWMNDPIPPGYTSDHYPIAIDLVPREGQGLSIHAAPWPRSATRTALAAAPISVVHPTAPITPNTPATPAGQGGIRRLQAQHCVPHRHLRQRKRIADQNRTAYKTITEASKAGKRPAKCCNPGK